MKQETKSELIFVGLMFLGMICFTILMSMWNP
jgi:hypothetical protein